MHLKRNKFGFIPPLQYCVSSNQVISPFVTFLSALMSYFATESSSLPGQYKILVMQG